MGDGAEDIEVGQVAGDGLDLWRATEAVRQGELRLSGQAIALASIEARAQAAVGWAAAALTAAAGLALGNVGGLPVRAGAAAATLPLVVGLVFALRALRPRVSDWRVAGDPAATLAAKWQTELAQRESVALGLAHGIELNRVRLDAAGSRLRVALTAIGLVPVAVAIGFAFATASSRSGW